ncbi:DUF7079 family protein [Zavarzinella formosa]|uniref:DUF7079 family protein n=1 Tax=Zavarzinella formosa TaxID=360055 RepID=UPI00036D6B76|nr:TIGR02996 domain-containing protein [Zavarzinella formosa]
MALINEAAFLLAIDAASGDMAPVLAFADWLDSGNDPRGEYVRLLMILETPEAVGLWPSVRVCLRELRPGINPDWTEQVGRRLLRWRRPLWSALGDLFLDQDSEVDGTYPFVASRVADSIYTPAGVRAILWDEVFPAVEWNRRHPCGEWTPFPEDWLEARILSVSPWPTAADSPEIARWVRKDWEAVCRHLPPDFR